MKIELIALDSKYRPSSEYILDSQFIVGQLCPCDASVYMLSDPEYFELQALRMKDVQGFIDRTERDAQFREVVTKIMSRRNRVMEHIHGSAKRCTTHLYIMSDCVYQYLTFNRYAPNIQLDDEAEVTAIEFGKAVDVRQVRCLLKWLSELNCRAKVSEDGQMISFGVEPTSLMFGAIMTCAIKSKIAVPMRLRRRRAQRD